MENASRKKPKMSARVMETLHFALEMTVFSRVMRLEKNDNYEIVNVEVLSHSQTRSNKPK